MIFSTIDIGTNTILMVTAQVEPDGTIRIIGDHHAIARLGKGVDASRTILPETFDRVAGYLQGYADISRNLGATQIVAFGTSALRDARNREEFIATIRERIGFTIEILSGEEEAALTYRGALFGLPMPENTTSAVIDIGGGSTEIAFGDGRKLIRSVSIDIGAVRITERFFQSLPPTPEEIDAARRHIREQLAPVFDLPAGTIVVGVAGTVTTLGAIELGMAEFNAAELNGRQLTASSIEHMTAMLCGLTLDRTTAIPQISSGRGDIILGGALILDELAQRYSLSSVVVGTRGVRYGVMLREVERVCGNYTMTAARAL